MLFIWMIAVFQILDFVIVDIENELLRSVLNGTSYTPKETYIKRELDIPKASATLNACYEQATQ
jgi:hypothetical protein